MKISLAYVVPVFAFQAPHVRVKERYFNPYNRRLSSQSFFRNRLNHRLIVAIEL